MPWLDLAKAAAHTSLSVRTLRRYLSDAVHPLPAYVVGGKLLLDSVEVDEWLRGFPRYSSQAGAIVEEMLRDIGSQKQRRPR